VKAITWDTTRRSGRWYAKGRNWARAAGADRVLEALRAAAKPWNGQWVVTCWDETTSTGTGTAEAPGSGVELTLSLAEHGERRAAESIKVAEKGRALEVAHGTSQFAGSSDDEATSRTGILLDCDDDPDGVGWRRLREILDAVGIGYVAQRRPAAGKFHVEVPFSEPAVLDGDYKPMWSCGLGWVLGVLSELVFTGDESRRFDPLTDRLLQLVHVYTRRSDEDPTPETAVGGSVLALDWFEFVCGLQFPLKDALSDEPPAATSTTPIDDDRLRGEFDRVALEKRIERAAARLREMPPSIEGDGGDDRLWDAARDTARGYALPSDVALRLLQEHFNPRCSPPWGEDRLVYKVNQATTGSHKPWGYLVNDWVDRLKARLGATATATASDDEDDDDPLPRNTDIGRADRFAAHHADDLRYLEDRKVWLRWSGHRWQAASKTHLQAAAKRTARHMLAEAYKLVGDEAQADAIKHALKASSACAISAMIELAASEPAFACEQKQLDQHHHLLTCTNGVVDLRDGSLRAHDRADYITTTTSIAYDPNACAPRWERFLHEVFADDEDLVGFIKRAVGYSLTGHTREHTFFVLHGGGRNGKGRFIRQVMALLGDAARTTSFSTFTAGRFAEGERNTPALAALAGARLVVAGEPDEGVRLSESVIKSLTGEDEVHACAKYEAPFTFTPRFKIWLHTNHRPEIRGTDEGIWRRPRLIPFNVTFEGVRADLRLDEKLDAERPGILRWAVEGAVEWFRDGLGTCEKVKVATEGYRAESDPITSFVEECLDPTAGAFITSAAMYASYQRWCERNGTEPWRGQTLSKRLIARGLKSDLRNHMRGFVDIAMRS
jgi:putative DNA primase/helicase